MCSPTWETDTYPLWYVCSPTWETHIPNDMCGPTWETRMLVICVPLPGKHISLTICAPLHGKQILIPCDMCVPLPGKHISLTICVAPPGKHVCWWYVFPYLGNTYLWWYVFPHLGNIYSYYWYILLHCCRPIVFSMDGDSTYEANFVLATLVDHDSSLPPSQASVTASANTSTKSATSKDKQAERWEGLHITFTEESDHLTTRPSHHQHYRHQEIDSSPLK